MKKLNLTGLSKHEKAQIQKQLQDSIKAGVYSGQVVPGARTRDDSPLFGDKKAEPAKQLDLF